MAAQLAAEQLTAVMKREGRLYSIVLLYPSVASQGKTINEAKGMIVDALTVFLEGLKELSEAGKRVPNLEPASQTELSELERALQAGVAVDHGIVRAYGINGPSFMPRNYDIRVLERK